MAMGDSRGSNKMYENTYYSRLRFKDHENKLNMSIKYKSGMMVLDIAKEKDNFQYESLIEVYLTSTKAKLFLREIKRYEDLLAEGKATAKEGYGITTGIGNVVKTICVKMNEKGGTAVSISKVDDVGNINERYDFSFNMDDFHYGLEWSNYDKMEVTKVFHNDLELELFKDALTQFSNVSSGALAYSVLDTGRYDYRALLNKMNPLYDKLGIERSGANGGRTSNGGYFNNNVSGPATSNHKSLEDVEDEFDVE